MRPWAASSWGTMLQRLHAWPAAPRGGLRRAAPARIRQRYEHRRLPGLPPDGRDHGYRLARACVSRVLAPRSARYGPAVLPCSRQSRSDSRAAGAAAATGARPTDLAPRRLAKVRLAPLGLRPRAAAGASAVEVADQLGFRAARRGTCPTRPPTSSAQPLALVASLPRPPHARRPLPSRPSRRSNRSLRLTDRVSGRQRRGGALQDKTRASFDGTLEVAATSPACPARRRPSRFGDAAMHAAVTVDAPCGPGAAQAARSTRPTRGLFASSEAPSRFRSSRRVARLSAEPLRVHGRRLQRAREAKTANVCGWYQRQRASDARRRRAPAPTPVLDRGTPASSSAARDVVGPAGGRSSTRRRGIGRPLRTRAVCGGAVVWPPSTSSRCRVAAVPIEPTRTRRRACALKSAPRTDDTRCGCRRAPALVVLALADLPFGGGRRRSPRRSRSPRCRSYAPAALASLRRGRRAAHKVAVTRRDAVTVCDLARRRAPSRAARLGLGVAGGDRRASPGDARSRRDVDGSRPCRVGRP